MLPRHSRGCIKRFSHLFRVPKLVRLLSTDTDQNDASPSLRVQTRKKYSELPKQHILEDGSVAKPLEPWFSGEREMIPLTGLRNTAVLPKTKDGTRGETPEDEAVSKPLRKRRRKVTEDEKNQDATSVKSESEHRARKNKVNLDGESSKIIRPTRKRKALVESAADDGQPRNTLAREILENLAKFPHCLLLTRVGQFYESYFDQAMEIARILNIKLTTRKWDGQRIAMCGFPIVHIDKYLKVMVQKHGRFVAMCEEFPRQSASGIRGFERRVTRIITPGTLIDESFLNQYENNYLLAIATPEPSPSDAAPDISPIGIAWIDVSTGEFFSRASDHSQLRDDLTRINPREIVLDYAYQTPNVHPLWEILQENPSVISYSSSIDLNPLQEQMSSDAVHASVIELQLSDGTSISHLPRDEVNPSQSAPTMYTVPESNAISLLTSYLQTNLLEHMPKLSQPLREDIRGRMHIDSHTIHGLEIRENIREGGTRGTLLSVIKRTLTMSGTRLLTRWLCSPSTSISEINARQALVALFHYRTQFRNELRSAIANVGDVGRIVQKFLLGRGDPADLLALHSSINVWEDIKNVIRRERDIESRDSTFDSISWHSLDILMERMFDLRDLSLRISNAIENVELSEANIPFEGLEGQLLDNQNEPPDETPMWSGFRSSSNKWAIKRDYSPNLLSLHGTLQSLFNEKEKLENKFQLAYAAPSLTLRRSPGLGLHVHLGKAKRDHRKLDKDNEFIAVSSSNSTKSYFHPKWSSLGREIFETSQILLQAERDAFEELRNEVNTHGPFIRRNGRILDELDVTLAFADLAYDMNFVRPLLADVPMYQVKNGRHPTVELGLATSGRAFTPNDVCMTESSNVHVITGPNMAGKSTLLRQTALITILAQTGSFVPADSAVIGVVDKLFSRIGAKDDLFHDRSTFMVEMLETAEILNRATSKSLVIMDEVGRGTTVKDGLAISFATLHHLVTANKCRTLFATHFYELAEMLGMHDNVGSGIFHNVSFYRTDVDETNDGHFAYAYRISPGVNADSHGLKVAHLAGMPQSVMSTAAKTLRLLKESDVYNTKIPQIDPRNI